MVYKMTSKSLNIYHMLKTSQKKKSNQNLDSKEKLTIKICKKLKKKKLNKVIN